MGFPKNIPDLDSLAMSDKVLKELQETFNKDFMWIVVNLYDFFQDYERVEWWLYTKNTMLGDVTPMKLIMLGRSYKVKQFIEANQKGNLP